MSAGRGDAPGEPVEVPHTELEPETLRRVVEEFVTRSGTDYGLRERTLDEKVVDVMRQLERGEARLVFDPEAGSVNIAPAQETPRTRGATRQGAR